MAHLSETLDVSAPTQDLKYILASTLNVSNFVSVKLSGCSNYDTWKAQMLCLIQSQGLQRIIQGQEEDNLTTTYDILVKGWIFGSLNQNVLKDFIKFESAKKVWMELESSFNPPISDAQGGPQREDLKYMEASNVIVSNFVTAKLSDGSNYKIWKAEMHSLIKSHGLLHIIDDEYPFPEDKGVHRIKQYDLIVKRWLKDSVEPTVDIYVEYSYSARFVWMKIESLFEPTLSYTKGDARTTEDLKYIQASNVNVSNFVTVKLSGYENYAIWETQMRCLLNSQALLNIIDDSHPFPGDKGVRMIKQYQELVRGWIFGSMTEKLLEVTLKDFRLSSSTHELWTHLNTRFSSPQTYRNTQDEIIGFKFKKELYTQGTDNANRKQRRERLYEAAVEGCWWKAKSILKSHQDAAKEPITTNHNTILHLAVQMGHNYFVEKLLDFLKDGNGIGTINNKGQTALKIAVMVGNKYAAQLLDQRSIDLLTVVQDSNQNPPYNSKSVCSAIITKQYDSTWKLLEKYPQDAGKDTSLLLAIAQSFPTDLGYMESFFYPSFHNVRQKTFMRGSLLFHYNFWDKFVDDVLRIVRICNNTCCSWLGNISMIFVVPVVALYQAWPLISLLIVVLRLPLSMLYFLLWKVLAITVSKIKNMEKTRKEYNLAKNILNLVCDNLVIGENKDSVYEKITFKAVSLDVYEVVDAILYNIPHAIKWKNENGHNIIQLAIINRSEKVYSLIHHIIKRTEPYRKLEDYLENNLAHLGGKLAPLSVLSCTTGAALKLQRELIWREEVEKLISPEELMKMNYDKETPAMVFTREHAELLKQGENWMKRTAESCSITAALIITVVFASAITVPGGTNQNSGIPLFRKDAAFAVFAFFNAFSLFTAATSLLLFLSILTARFSEKDFRLSLPLRLIFGLLTLFLSTTTMIIAFGAILFLVFCDHRPWMLAPICAFSGLPILVIVMVKVPLLIDLIQSTYFPNFGKQSYLDSCKTNRRNTILD